MGPSVRLRCARSDSVQNDGVTKSGRRKVYGWNDVGDSRVSIIPARFENIGASSINNSYASLLGPIDLSMIFARLENSPVAICSV